MHYISRWKFMGQCEQAESTRETKKFLEMVRSLHLLIRNDVWLLWRIFCVPDVWGKTLFSFQRVEDSMQWVYMSETPPYQQEPCTQHRWFLLRQLSSFREGGLKSQPTARPSYNISGCCWSSFDVHQCVKQQNVVCWNHLNQGWTGPSVHRSVQVRSYHNQHARPLNVPLRNLSRPLNWI